MSLYDNHGIDIPERGWSLNNKGYLIYTSRATKVEVTRGVKRGAKQHRVVIEKLLGRPLNDDEHVHHQDFNRRHNCGYNLLVVPMAFNPSRGMRCPYTGRFMSVDKWSELYGKTKSNEPDWLENDGF